MKRERTTEQNIRRIDREKANRVHEGTPSSDDGQHLDFAFDGEQLRIKYQGDWWRFDATQNKWIKG